MYDLSNHHDPPFESEGILRVLKFTADEPEALDDFLESVGLATDTIIASSSFESETILVIRVHSFKNDPSAFDTFFLEELKIWSGITCIYKGEEDEPCQEHA